MKSMKLLISLLGLGLCAPVVRAEFVPLAMSADVAIQRAFLNNPNLRIAELAVERAESRLRYAGRLNDPELGVSYSTDRLGEDEGEERFEFALTQQFPLTAALNKEKKLRTSQIRLAEAELAEFRRNLAVDVEQAIIQLGLLLEQKAVNASLNEGNIKILDFLKAQMDRGEASNLDVTQAELTSATLRQQIRVQESAEHQLKARLKLLLGMANHEALRVKHSFALPDHLISAPVFSQDVLHARPDYVLALAEMNASSMGLALEEARGWSEVGVRIFVEQEESVDEPSGLEENTIAGIGFSIPLPLFKGNRAAVSEAELDKRVAEIKRDALVVAIQSEYDQALELRKSSFALAQEMASDILVLAEQNFKALVEAFEAGQVSLLQVQQAQGQLLDVKTTSLETTASFFEAAAQFRFIQGDYPAIQNAPLTNDEK